MLRRWFQAPTFDDQDTTRVAGLVNVILNVILLALVFYLPLLPFLYPQDTVYLDIIMLVVIGLWVGAMRALMWRGHLRLVSWVLTGFLWFALTVMIILYGGGVNNPTFNIYLIVILIANLLLGTLAALVFTVMSLVSGLLLLYGEYTHALLDPVYASSFELLLMAFASFTIVGLLRRATFSIRDALKLSQQNQQALVVSNRDLTDERNFVTAILDTIGNLVVVLDGEGRIVRFNRAAERITGYAHDEVAGRFVWDVFVLPEELEAVRGSFRSLSEDTAPHYYENYWRTKDGRRRLIAWTNTTLTDSTGSIRNVISTGVDITERRQAEEALRSANRAFRVLSDCNQVLIRAQEENELLQEICQTMVDTGGYHMVWVGYADNTGGRRVRPAAWAGHEDNYLQQLMRTWSDGDAEQYPIQVVMQTRQPLVIENIADYMGYYPTRTDALTRGYGSLMVFPLVIDGQAMGVLNVYFARVSEASSEEINLLNELAGDLAYGIEALRTRAERIQMTEALRRSEATFRHLFANNPLSMWVYHDETLAFLDVNDAAIEHYGYSRDEFLRMRISDIRPPEDVPRLLEVIRRARPDMRASRQWRHRLKDGRIIDVDIASHRINFEGQPAALVVAQDITERKRAEEQVRYHANLLENVSDAVISTDLDFVIVSWNKAAESIYGWQAAEVIGRPFAEVVTTEITDEQKPILQALRSVLVQDGAWSGEIIQYTREGDRLNISVSVSLIYDHLGSPAGAVSVNRDVTAYKKAQQALHRSEEQFQTMFDEALDAILVIDNRDGRIAQANRASQSVLGYDDSRLVGEHFSLLFSPQMERLSHDILETIWAEGVVFESLALLRADGSICPMDLSATLIPWDDDRAVLMTLRDVSDRKRMEEELLKAELARVELEKERELVELRESFIAMVSHQFRTPLTVILSSNQLLENYYERLTPEKRLNYLRQIRTQIDYMTALLDDVLVISKARTGRLEFAPEPLNLETFCHSEVEKLRFVDEERHNLIFDSAGQFEECMVDARLLQHIVTNLLSNAIKYTPEGKTIRFTLFQDERDAVLQIQDEGIGIPAKDQERLFEPFHRARNTGEIRGTGLGLSIVKESVEAHGGSIAFDSVEGAGTTFVVRLPIG